MTKKHEGKRIVVVKSISGHIVKLLREVPSKEKQNPDYNYEELHGEEAHKAVVEYNTHQTTARVQAERGGRKFSD